MTTAKSDGNKDNAAAGQATCAVCMGAFGEAEVYFHATVSGHAARICPRCLHILIHGMSIAEARMRMGIPTVCEGDGGPA